MAARYLKGIFFSLFLFALGFGIVFMYQVYAELKRPMMGAGRSEIIEVKPNSTANALINTLYDRKLIHSKSILLNFIQFKQVAHRLKAGIYEVLPGDSAEALIDKIIAGQVMSKAFLIIEGANLHQVTQHLAEAPYLKYNSEDWSVVTRANSNAEGLLLADTYYYNAGSDAKQLLQMAHKKLTQYLEEAWQHRDKSLPYKSAYEMLIVASILEKEAGLVSERKIISGIVVNRLLKNMPLQMDPTVIYALGLNYTGKLLHSDLSVDSPYNTYRYRGLPPTPIAMVGREAINAAAHPEQTNYLYFVAKGDGSHVFSRTYAEQKEAILRYMSNGS